MKIVSPEEKESIEQIKKLDSKRDKWVAVMFTSLLVCPIISIFASQKYFDYTEERNKEFRKLTGQPEEDE